MLFSQTRFVGIMIFAVVMWAVFWVSQSKAGTIDR